MPRRLFPSREERERVIFKAKHCDQLILSYLAAGLSFVPESRRVEWLSDPYNAFACEDLASFLSQLEEQGLAEATDGVVLIAWQQVYELQSSEDYSASYPLLGLPQGSSLRPCLASRGSFSDADFSIFVSGWVGPNGATLAENPRIEGAIIVTKREEALLERAAWETLRAVAAFHERELPERTVESNRACWSKIRQHAKAARAQLSHFLETTVVIAPEELTIGLRTAEVGGGKVVEVLPNFPGEPPGWLQTFDRFDQVRECYEVAHGQRLTHVVITPEVGTVLREIKRMPARRVTGERAEAFLRNPFASLGPDAGKVLNPAQFEQAREQAGIWFARFSVHLPPGAPASEVSLLIDEGDVHQGSSQLLPFTDPGELEQFIAKLEERMRREAQCCPWHGYELEILGDTPDQVSTLRVALASWRGEEEYKSSEIFDLSSYSARVEGFGAEKPYSLPSMARRREGEGWFPGNDIFGVGAMPDGSERPPGITLCEENTQEVTQQVIRNSLIIKPNVEQVDYAELGGDLSFAYGSAAVLPRTLRRGAVLLEHQLRGVAWLQHLWHCSPATCRGALLADDMGLGKTLQVLTFIAWCVEHDPGIDPFLIVAPVALLENWKEEMEKFFMPGALSVLTLYGAGLGERRMPRTAIQAELLHAGIARLLIRDWLGNANVVLTTYETMRDLEFSLARQKWSVMICDEAQKIKTPNAMVSRAAKKQNARFKIACTGTPVENTLTDLWCLFDFIQPGLLGCLKDFGERYRRPIEAETEQEKIRVEELRKRIAPQTLRRTKAEVARDLPAKIVACGSLPISERQRAYYGDALGRFRSGAGTFTLRNHLGLLLYLRSVCCDPRPAGGGPCKQQTLFELERDSPKMRWLLAELVRIQEREEKVIVFCELKELQRTIQRAIAERLALFADILNGDSSAAAERMDSRQKRIRLFQNKPGFGVIILSPLAVGFGVNLQAANHVIHFTRAWNPAREDQGTDRAYRIGQAREVFVYHPVVVANDFVTFDEKLAELLEKKRRLSEDMLNGSGDIATSEFSGVGGGLE